MEGTRIPKLGSALRPPRQFPSSSQSKPPPAVSAAKQPEPSRFLRRRSKSVTDLRPAAFRAITALRPTTKANILSNNDKGSSARPGQKRPLKTEEPSRPKVAKTKIPDWDYKSRFQELQRKYADLVQDVNESKVKLSNLASAESELERLRQENSQKEKDMQELKSRQERLTEENTLLHTDKLKMQKQLSLLHEANELLTTQHNSLTAKYQQNMIEFQELQNGHSRLQLELQELSMQHENIKSLVQVLQRTILEHEHLRRTLHNTIQDMKGNIRVFCRVRPPVAGEKEKQLCSMHFPDETALEIRKARESVATISGRQADLKQEFTFDKVFAPEASQTEVFEELSQLVQSALDGFHVCVFAYGQTGSGKTYTMQGYPPEHGMIPRTIDTIFDGIEKLKLSGWSYKVTASFLEIYNENVRDLLEPNSGCSYELRYNEGRGVTVSNLKIIAIEGASDMKRLMEEAQKNRAVAATDFNLHSSRSHAVTKIHLKGRNSTSKLMFSGSINLVDLAGSESAKTSASDRLTETKNINKSLSTLGSVMLALHNKDPHIPYRNSKLTFLLQSCLGGNSKTLMFVNISPFEECYAESINSLRFASKVKDVKIIAKKNKGYINVVS